MPLAPGTRFGPYEIIASLGAGGMGEVYRARDTRLDRDVALKILPEAFANDPDRRARFEREAKAVAALSHPNILAIFDVGESPSAGSGQAVVYAATELLEGQTLRDRLQSGPLPPRKAIELAVQIARGLSSAHDRGIVHRDLKPENLFLVGDGQIKILDFGLARQAAAAAGSGATQTIAATDPGTVLGTVGYMAPEQVRGRTVDARADLFSLGVVLYEMVSGHRAFQRDTAADTMSAILREDPPEVSGTRPDVSPALDRIIRHCLEKEPDERFQTARDVAFALTALSGSATSISGPVPAASGGTSGRGWVLAAAIAIAAALGGMWAGRAMVADAFDPVFTALTFDHQAIFTARFMPDDETVVFSAAVSGNAASLFELRPGSGVPRGFGPPRTHLLSISGSGELAVLTDVRFVSHRIFTGTLSRMSMDSAPRAVASGVRDADWLPDGSDLVVVREAAGEDLLEFPMGKVVHRTAGYMSAPRVSPDGTRVAFLEHPEKFDNRGWAKVVDRNGRVTSLSEQYWGAETVAWSADGQLVLHAGATVGDYQLWAAPPDGASPPVAILPSPGSLYIHDTASDGRALITREDSRYGVVARGAGQDAERDLSVNDQSWSPMLFPDGRSVVFGDGRAGEDYGVVIRGVDGAAPARIGSGNSRAISPDGLWVSANLFSSGRCVAYPTGLGAMVSIEMGALERCTNVEWFPDGKHVFIIGNEAGKPTRAYQASFPSGTPEPMLPDGVLPSVISATGLRVLAKAPDGTWQNWEVGGGATPVLGLRTDDVPIAWEAGDRSVLVGSHARVPALVDRVDLTTGQRVTVGEYAPADRAGLLLVRPRMWLDGGRQYSYDYVRRVSTLFMVTGTR
jgi:hypothetical protein